MSLNLHDHSLRLADLELAVHALTEALTGSEAAKRQAVVEAARKLQARGAKGAADLLAGRFAEAAYRR